MKLLFDQNLSPRLVRALEEVFPGSDHVRNVGLGAADDETIWRHAADNGFAIVSKDADFHQMSFLYGPPPKVVWLRVGNCSTDAFEARLRARAADIARFGQAPEAAFVVID
ncbi:MAG: DUF5615 family PIN-like protein [Myxococcota bacterium]